MGPVVERKALTALRQEGLVRARPRVGTVVASLGPGPARARRRVATEPDHELTRERIVRAAIGASGRHPTFTGVTRALGDDYDLDLDELFEFGLKPMLDGLTVFIEG